MWILGLKGFKLGCNRAVSHRPLPLGVIRILRGMPQTNKQINKDKNKNKNKTKFHSFMFFPDFFQPWKTCFQISIIF